MERVAEELLIGTAQPKSSLALGYPVVVKMCIALWKNPLETHFLVTQDQILTCNLSNRILIQHHFCYSLLIHIYFIHIHHLCQSLCF